jgi:hypothetical protein
MPSVDRPVDYPSPKFAGVGLPVTSTGPFSPEVIAVAASRGQAEQLPKVLEITRQLFPGPVHLVAAEDPEIDDHRYIIFEVIAVGSIPEVLELQSEWLRRVHACARPRSDVFTLSIDIQQ